MTYESKKNAHLGEFFIRLNELDINLIDVNFHLQESLEIFDKNSADKTVTKSDPKRTRK